MSRHEKKVGQYEIAVGWDRMLQTYYGIVYDRSIEDPDEQIILWVGGSPPQLYEIEDLRKAMSDPSYPHVFIEARRLIDDLTPTLYCDKDLGR